MLLPYQFYIGGTVGSGNQWLSWIHIDDVASMIDFIIHKEEIDGPLNITAPDPIRMKEFGEIIATIIKTSLVTCPFIYASCFIRRDEHTCTRRATCIT